MHHAEKHNGPVIAARPAVEGNAGLKRQNQREGGRRCRAGRESERRKKVEVAARPTDTTLKMEHLPPLTASRPLKAWFHFISFDWAALVYGPPKE